MMSNASIPVLSVSEFTQIYSQIVINTLDKKLPISSIHSVFLWGAPGVGKSQGVSELAKILENSTGKRVEVTDIRLLLMNPVDLHGIPSPNKDKTMTVWLKPQLFNMPATDDVINILFLDELSAAPPAVQAAAYQLVLDRKVGEHTLPDNTLVIGAGNRVNDRSVAYHMPKALANRFSHFEICPDAKSWNNWAINKEINPYVVAYLKADESRLLMSEDNYEELAYPTPRTWEFVSDYLNLVDADTDLSPHYKVIASYIGNAMALEFVTWVKSHKDLPRISDIFAGNKVTVPSSMDGMFLVTSSIVSYVTCKLRLGIRAEELENMAAYVLRLPTDFAISLYSDLLGLRGIHDLLSACDSFVKWTQNNEKAYIALCKRQGIEL